MKLKRIFDVYKLMTPKFKSLSLLSATLEWALKEERLIFTMEAYLFITHHSRTIQLMKEVQSILFAQTVNSNDFYNKLIVEICNYDISNNVFKNNSAIK